MKKLSIKSLLLVVGALLSIVALIFLAMTGLTATNSGAGITATTTVALGGFVFGGLKFVTTTTGLGATNTTTATFEGGMSYFVLISVILIVLGLAATIASIFLKKQGKLLAIIGGILIVVGAIFIMLIKCGGADLKKTMTAGSVTATPTKAFKDAFENYSLGTGTICYFVFALLSGLIITGSQFIPTKKLSKKRK
mgnify:CR=1 FL=1